MVRVIVEAWLIASVLSLAGCTMPEPIQQDPQASVVTDDAVRWPYWPEHIRVHPLTRLTIDAQTGRLIIEARIELTDVDGHSSRGCGQLQIRMVNLAAPDQEEPVAHWKMDLSDRPFNRQQFDPVTQTYLFRLEVDESQLEGQPQLRAYYLTGDGRALAVNRLQLRTE